MKPSLSLLGEPVGKAWAQFLSTRIPDSFRATIPQLSSPSPVSPIAAVLSLLGGWAAFLDHPI